MVADVDVKTFLLGVGCQKGGTTWLQQYLASAPECEAGFGTEYMIFDCLDVPEHTWMRRRIIERARSSIDAVENGVATRSPALQQLAMMADTQVYYDYFAALLARPGVRLTLDVTPNYALLPAPRLAEIRDEMSRRDVRPLALFLMRDPVERIWSQVRMHKQRGRRSNPLPDHTLVEQRYANPTTTLRTRYEDTVRRLDEVFGPDAVHYDFYERLFTEDRLRAVSEFVGIEYRPGDVDRRRNVSPKDDALPDDTVRRVATHYRSTYDFVAERFGIDDIGELWPSSRLLG